MRGIAKPKPDSPEAETSDTRLVRWAEAVLRWRVPILGLAAVLTVWLGGQCLHLRTEFNEQAELPAGDSEVVRFQRFQDRYGGQEFLLVVLQTDDVFAPDFLGYLRELTEDLRDTPHATDVVSLATAALLRGEGEGAKIEPFLTDLPATPAEAATLRQEALDRPAWVGSLVSADGGTACINVMLPSLSTDISERMETADTVWEILSRNSRPGVQAYVTGYSPLARDMHTALNNDIRRFLLLTPVLILICLFWAFRTWRGVLAPVLVIVAAVGWTLGLLSLFGGALNIATSLLPTLVAINCLSYSIHLLNAYHESCAKGSHHRKVLVRTMAHMAPALTMAAVTTAIGFGSLGLSDLRSLRFLGLFSGAGILISWVLCLTVIPALLSFLPMPARTVHHHRSLRLLRRGLWRVADLVNRDRWMIPLVLTLVLILSAVGIRRIAVETQVTEFLPDAAPSIQGLRVMEQQLAGFTVLELELSGDSGVFQEPWALREMDGLQRRIAAIPGVEQVVSANDWFREVHQARNPDSSAAGAAGLPETAGQIAEYRLLFSLAGRGDLLDSFMISDGSAVRISARIRSMSTAGHLRLLAEVEQIAAQHLDPRLSLNTTGTIKLFAVRSHALVRSLFKSYGLSFLLIAIVMMLQLRSLRAGLCSMIPNVLPIFLAFGLMGFLGIPLRAGTVMIASVGIGIAVDDTIHILMRYRRELGPGRSPASAVRRTLLGTGRAMVFSSLGLAAGFSILMISAFQPNREFGLLTAFIMVVALLADLLATPYLVRAFRLFRKEPP